MDQAYRGLLYRGMKIMITAAVVLGSVAAAPMMAFATDQTQTSATGTDVGASGNGSGGSGQDNGNGNDTSKTDNGGGNGGVDNGQGSTPTSIPEAPLSLVFPLALGVAAMVVYRKNRKSNRTP